MSTTESNTLHHGGSSISKASRSLKPVEVPAITTTPFPNSKKVFVKGALHDIQVAMREITVTDSPDPRGGKGEQQRYGG